MSTTRWRTDLLELRPDDEPLAETFRAVIRESLGGLYRRDPERLLSRVRLMATVPELRSRFLDEQTHGIEQLAPELARKRGARVDELRLRVIGSALLAAVGVALDLWQRDDGKGTCSPLLTGRSTPSPAASATCSPPREKAPNRPSAAVRVARTCSRPRSRPRLELESRAWCREKSSTMTDVSRPTRWPACAPLASGASSCWDAPARRLRNSMLG